MIVFEQTQQKFASAKHGNPFKNADNDPAGGTVYSTGNITTIMILCCCCCGCCCHCCCCCCCCCFIVWCCSCFVVVVVVVVIVVVVVVVIVAVVVCVCFFSCWCYNVQVSVICMQSLFYALLRLLLLQLFAVYLII